MRETTDVSQLPTETQNKIAQQERIKVLRAKHIGKKPSDLNNADVMEWIKEKMSQELAL